jgi:hypothetical protein
LSSNTSEAYCVKTELYRRAVEECKGSNGNAMRYRARRDERLSECCTHTLHARTGTHKHTYVNIVLSSNLIRGQDRTGQDRASHSAAITESPCAIPHHIMSRTDAAADTQLRNAAGCATFRGEIVRHDMRYEVGGSPHAELLPTHKDWWTNRGFDLLIFRLVFT